MAEPQLANEAEQEEPVPITDPIDLYEGLRQETPGAMVQAWRKLFFPEPRNREWWQYALSATAPDQLPHGSVLAEGMTAVLARGSPDNVFHKPAVTQQGRTVTVHARTNPPTTRAVTPIHLTHPACARVPWTQLADNGLYTFIHLKLDVCLSLARSKAAALNADGQLRFLVTPNRCLFRYSELRRLPPPEVRAVAKVWDLDTRKRALQGIADVHLILHANHCTIWYLCIRDMGKPTEALRLVVLVSVEDAASSSSPDVVVSRDPPLGPAQYVRVPDLKQSDFPSLLGTVMEHPTMGNPTEQREVRAAILANDPHATSMTENRAWAEYRTRHFYVHLHWPDEMRDGLGNRCVKPNDTWRVDLHVHQHEKPLCTPVAPVEMYEQRPMRRPSPCAPGCVDPPRLAPVETNAVLNPDLRRTVGGGGSGGPLGTAQLYHPYH